MRSLGTQTTGNDTTVAHDRVLDLSWFMSARRFSPPGLPSDGRQARMGLGYRR